MSNWKVDIVQWEDKGKRGDISPVGGYGRRSDIVTKCPVKRRQWWDYSHRGEYNLLLFIKRS